MEHEQFRTRSNTELVYFKVFTVYLGPGLLSLCSPPSPLKAATCEFSALKNSLNMLKILSDLEVISKKASAWFIWSYLGEARFKMGMSGNSLVVQWLGLHAFTARAWVQSLVRELRSHKLCGMAKNKRVCHKLAVVWGHPRTRRPPTHQVDTWGAGQCPHADWTPIEPPKGTVGWEDSAWSQH